MENPLLVILKFVPNAPVGTVSDVVVTLLYGNRIPKFAAIGPALFRSIVDVPTYGNTRLLAIPNAVVVNTVFPRGVQVIPSGELASVLFVPVPAATHTDPFHATAHPRPPLKTVVDCAAHTPLVHVTTAFVPDPTVTPIDPFHPPPEHSVKRLGVTPAQVIASDDVAIELDAPAPLATHTDPFQNTSSPVVRILFPDVEPVHTIPSREVAIVFVPDPTATHNDPLHATPFP